MTPGSLVCNLELLPGDGGKLVKSSGTYATVVAHTDEGTLVKLPSGKSIYLKDGCLGHWGWSLAVVEQTNLSESRQEDKVDESQGQSLSKDKGNCHECRISSSWRRLSHFILTADQQRSQETHLRDRKSA